MFNKRIKYLRIIPAIALAIGLSGCGATTGTTESNVASDKNNDEGSVAAVNDASEDESTGETVDNESTNESTNESDEVTEEVITATDEASEAEYINSFDATCTIEFDGDDVNITGTGAAFSDGKVIISEDGEYDLIGESDTVEIVINVPDTDKIKVRFNSLSLTSDDNCPITVISADKVTFITAKGTANYLEDNSSYTNLQEEASNADAVIFSKSDIAFKGQGELYITSNYKHGIVSKDDLKISSGTIEVTATNTGISGNDSVEITGGDIKVIAGTNGVKSETLLAVAGGKVEVTKSYEGFEAPKIYIMGGISTIVASDDGLNASGDSATTDTTSSDTANGDNMFMDNPMAGDDTKILEISGGILYVNANGDAIDSNGRLIMSGGEVYVSGPTNNGNGSLDSGTAATITGGTIIACGSNGMAENFGNASTQCSIMVNVANGTAGDKVMLVDSDGNILSSYVTSKTYASVLISTPEISVGETYTVCVGDTTNIVSTVILSDTIYSEGGTSQMGGHTGGMQTPDEFGGQGDKQRPGRLDDQGEMMEPPSGM